MPLTREFKETVQARAKRDPDFRSGLLKEGVECMLAGDVDTGKTILRDYINATIGFSELGELTNKQPKSLMRMLGPHGNPQARNLFEIIGCIQLHEGIQLEVRAIQQSLVAPAQIDPAAQIGPEPAFKPVQVIPAG